MDDVLDALLARQAEEEAEAARRRFLDHPRPLGLRLPRAGRLPESSHWLELFYTHMVREKKPCVFDHLRSWGPWMVSVDEAPLSVLDGMSQTATVPAGFSPDEVVAAYLRGDFGDTACKAGDTTVHEHVSAEALRKELRRRLPSELRHITFASSGAEANEKAFALCHAERPERRHILAFEGSFHGRMLLALHATWNPVKREPFELEGYEVRFAPYPLWVSPTDQEPGEPPGFLEIVGSGAIYELEQRFGDADDPVLRTEVEALLAVHESLADETVMACIIEPMQSEGGDRYSTARFHRALRLLTRHHDVPLIYDEVQTGFGLGGTFFWHERFNLVDKSGHPDFPDMVTMAKRAQVGIVAGRFHDPQPTAAHTASLVRGRLHAEIIGDGRDAHRIEQLVRPRLARIAETFPELVSAPRCRGYAVAFDLPEPAHLSRYIAQRFWRGAVVFGAGKQTIRYRLSRAWEEPHVDMLVGTIEASLTWLREHPGEEPPVWHDEHTRDVTDDFPKTDSPDTRATRVRRVQRFEATEVLQRVLQLEAQIFEPARRDPPERLRMATEHVDGLALIAEVSGESGWELAGYAFACPLELVPEIKGPDQDPLRGQGTVLYSIAISVSPDYRGLRLGARLKSAQIREARLMKRSDGKPRYEYIVARNRIGAADVMTRINRRYGAYGVRVLEGQYGEEDARALYYRIPLRALAPRTMAPGEADPNGPNALDDPDDPGDSDDAIIDLADGVAAPFGPGPASLLEAEAAGRLFGPAVNKITICNYVTPTVARAVEWIGQLTTPSGLPYLYLASSRDETVDKSIRVLRYARNEGQVMIGVDGGYLGHTSAAARSLSDPETHRLVPDYFDWPRIPHPTDGVDVAIEALRRVISEAGGAHRVLGLMLETVQEQSGRVVPEDFWPALTALRDETGIPVVVAEHTSACYRSGEGAFAVLAAGFRPDILTWWGGGQTAFLHVTEPLHVQRPLTFVSTWDGDELSMMRVHHHLRTAYQLDLRPAIEAMDATAALLESKGLTVRGLGLYRVARGEAALMLHRGLQAHGILVHRMPSGALALAPRLDTAVADLARLDEAIEEII